MVHTQSPYMDHPDQPVETLPEAKLPVTPFRPTVMEQPALLDFPPTLGEVLYHRLRDVCVYLLSATSAVLLVRFVLMAEAARDAPFLRLVVAVSAPLLAPFHGLFPTLSVNGHGTLELDDLAAVFGYALGAALLCGLLALLLLPVHKGRAWLLPWRD